MHTDWNDLSAPTSTFINDYINNKLPNHVNTYFVPDYQLAARYGLPFIPYEGGQHFADSNNQARADYFMNANRDPLMRTLYKAYFDEWARVTNNSNFMHFASTGMPGLYGSWGVLEYYYSPHNTSYKYLGLHDYLGVTAPPTQSR